MASTGGMPRMMLDGPESIRRRILDLAATRDAEEVAAIANVPLGTVRAILDEVPASQRWWLRDNKTGRCWTKIRSDRGAYQLVCMLGLTDWDWGLGSIPGERVQP